MHAESSVEEGTSREVLVGLYVRDALGVVDPSGLPRLLGTGLRDAGTADEATNWWWQRWWMDIVESRDDRISLPPQLAETGDRALRTHLDDARTWADVVYEQAGLSRLERFTRGDVFPIVTDQPLRLRVEILPLTTAGIWWIGENAIAVDELLRDDLSSYALALEPIVDRLLSNGEQDASGE